MGRQARQFSETGLYHIVFRGINHCHLFETDDDYEKFMGIMEGVKIEYSFKLYAYCLMSNHVHLFLEEIEMGDIVKVMKKLLTHYAGWFNRKYSRSGSLIANRYKSECVEKDEYLLSLIRYIHNNPIEAGIAEKYDEYKWSSYIYYISDNPGLVDRDFILGILSTDENKAKPAFIEFHADSKEEVFLPTDKKRKSEEQIRREIVKFLNGKEPNHVTALPRDERDKALSGIKNLGFSVRQIERATGVSRGIIQKCCQNRTVPK